MSLSGHIYSLIIYDNLFLPSSIVIVGGADKNVVVFHKDTEQILATLKGHTKRVTAVIYHNAAVSQSLDS